MRPRLPGRAPAVTSRAPGSVTDAFWVAVTAPGVTPGGERSGKWLVFVPAAHHDEVWSRIAAATVAGRLGTAAKAQTAREAPYRAEGAPRLICVYTADHGDLADVERVLGGLRDLGIAGHLSYKTDAATLAGRYGKGTAAYVSRAGTRQAVASGGGGM